MKQRALDLITNLRLETDILNEKKNAAADKNVNSQTKGAPIEHVTNRTKTLTSTEILEKELSKKKKV